MCKNYQVQRAWTDGGIDYIVGDVVAIECDVAEWLAAHSPGTIATEPTDQPATRIRIVANTACGGCGPVVERPPESEKPPQRPARLRQT